MPVSQEILLTLKHEENMRIIASPGHTGLWPNSLPGGPAGQGVQGVLENLPLPGKREAGGDPEAATPQKAEPVHLRAHLMP